MYSNNSVNIRSLEIGYILFLPIIVAFTYDFPLFNNHAGFLDSWVYFGYIHNFQDLVDRYGLPYYSVRFGLIYPHILAASLFSPVTAYLLVVYSMYLLAGIPYYLLFRKQYDIHAAVLAYAILVSSMWFGRTVLWTHPDATAVPYLIAAFSLMFLDLKHKRVANVAIGILVGMAVNSNVFALVIAGLGVLSALIYHQSSSIKKKCLDALWMLAGFSLVLAAGSVGYYVCCSTGNYFTPTLAMITWSNEGGGTVYKKQLLDVLKINYIYFPVLVSLLFSALLLDRRIQRIRLVNSVVLYLVACMAFYVSYEIYAQSAIIETFYYFSFMQVPLIFSVPILILLLANKSASRTTLLNVAILIFLIIPLILSFVVGEYPVYIYLAGCVLTLTVLLLALTTTRFIPLAVVMITMVTQLFWNSEAILGKTSALVNYGSAETAISRFRLGLKFIDAMPRMDFDKKPVYFWYSNKDSLANSLQSTYLWGYSRLMESGPEMPGMPDVKGLNQDILQIPISLVIFDLDNDMVEQGILELQKLGLDFTITSKQQLCEEELCYNIAHLDTNGIKSLSERNWNSEGLLPVSFEIFWNDAGSGSDMIQEGVVLSVKTLPVPWNYVAIGRFAYQQQPLSGPIVVRLLVSVRDASIGVGFTGDNVSNFVKRMEVLPASGPQELFFEFANPDELKNIVISSWGKAESANVDIHDLEIRLLKSYERI